MTENEYRIGRAVWAAFKCSVLGWAVIQSPMAVRARVERLLASPSQWGEGGPMLTLCDRVVDALRGEFGQEVGALELSMALDLVSATIKADLCDVVMSRLQAEAN